MISSEHCQQYAILLRIRQKAARRDSFILGAIWGISLAAAFVYNFFSELNSAGVFLALVLLILLGFGFVLQLARLETLRHMLEMVDFLQRESQAG